MIELKKESIELRKVYSQTLKEILEKDKKVYILEADLADAVTTGVIHEEFPKNYIDVGIMEANMIGVASGLSLLGKIPYIHTFSPFASRRCYDQIYLSGAYAKSNMKIFGSDTGISAQFNGGTHTSFEDISLMRNIPTATVMTITDSTMFKNILNQIKDIYGIHYFTAIRKNAYKIYDEDEKFVIGKGKVLCEGNDVTIVATGIMVAEGLKAAALLKERGYSATVIDMFTIKPIDADLLIKYAKKTKGIVTAENHNIIGGLGSAVSEVITENYPTIVKKVGVKDRFGQVGTMEFLQDEYGLNAKNILEKALEILND